MFRTRAEQVSGWEAALPAELLRLPEELARVDALLDDPVFFAPFAPFFDPQMGRPSTPMETYLRLMFLKFRYRLGYESLCREVADSISWRRFCRIRLDGQVPHPTTLMKLTTRCGPTAVDACNEALLARATEAKLLRCARLRADTTVVPANVAYPTDSGLLAKSVRRIAATGRRIQAAGGAIRTRLRDRSRAAGSRAHAIAAKLRLRGAAGREEAQAVVRRITGELAGLAERAAADAEQLLFNARRALRRARVKGTERAAAGVGDAAAGRRRGRLHRAVNDLTDLLAAPGGSPHRPVSASAGSCPRARPGGSACTTGTPARSRRAGWGGPSSSATKARSSTTTTVWCSTTPWSGAIPPMLRNWPPRSAGSSAAPLGGRGPSPLIAARARPAWRTICTISASRPWSSHARADRARPAKPTSTAERSAERSSGAPEARPGSAPSNGSTGGTAPASTTSTGPGSGPDTGSSPTTWSRSPPWRADQPPNGDQINSGFRSERPSRRHSRPNSGRSSYPADRTRASRGRAGEVRGAGSPAGGPG